MERRKPVGTVKEREVVEDPMVIDGEAINGSDADEAELTKHGSFEEIKKYLFFNPRLRGDAYEAGDIYDTKLGGQEAAEWEINCKERPYLTHIKSLSTTWPHLRILADFMEVTTAPLRWGKFLRRNKRECDERASKTNVTRLDYLSSGKVVSQSYTNFQDLKQSLEDPASGEDAGSRNFRLFIVEDLSRDVIELMGASLDIEPEVFRDQIFDYSWYNVRDRWMNPRRLSVAIRRQRWVQLRFVTARYFKDLSSFKDACREAESWNVHRNVEDDLNNKAIWDERGAIVGLSRSRASFWLSGTDGTKSAVGVIFVDPTITKGFPLWHDYLDWKETPSMHEKKPPGGPPRTSLYKDLIYWAQDSNAFQPSSTNDLASNVDRPIQALLQLVCSEWLTITEYIKTRLIQIEWELTLPETFLDEGIGIDVALRKLHVWRRTVPLYREMLTDTLQRVFQIPCNTVILANNGTGLGSIGNNTDTPANHTHLIDRCDCPLHNSPSVNAMREDFIRILSYMEEYDRRIERLTSVVTAVISIDDSQRSREQSKSVAARFTVLAVIFVPLSFIASLFSMTDNIDNLKGTMKWYWITALSFAFLCLLLVYPAKYVGKLKPRWF